MVTLVQTPRFLLRLPTDLREQLDAVAEQEHRSLTNQIIHALREWLAGRGKPQES